MGYEGTCRLGVDPRLGYMHNPAGRDLVTAGQPPFQAIAQTLVEPLTAAFHDSIL